MEAGIVGLPNVGKTTLFNALTGAAGEVGNYPFTTTKPETAVARVPDARLALIHRYIETQKIVPATIRVVDMPALVRGASEGEGMGNQFLGQVRNVDALLHVVRCFEDADVAHVDDSVDPLRDIETVDLELIAADASVVGNSLAKARKMARLGDKEAKLRAEALEACEAVLGELRPVRAAGLSDEHLRALRGYALLTAKPVLYVANVGEGEADSADAESSPQPGSAMVDRVRGHAAEQGGRVVAVSAKLEAELAELEEADRGEMLRSLGLSEPALAAVAREVYALLGLHSFFTAGPKEIRAWPIPIGAMAHEAAGAIHSDIQRGFIRAEVYHVNDLAHHGSEQAIKTAGKLRIEGKSYIVRAGDVCHFLFNV